jgi:hypothetical protein
MKTRIILFLLSLASTVAQAGYTCPDGTTMACMDKGDSVCPMTAKCVDKAAICLAEPRCDSDRGYICGSEYDAVLKDHQETVDQYNGLLSENVSLREDRLEKRNCVINAETLKDAISCVRRD